ncbi:HEAT repeat-containing protein 6 [Lycorma delicatula]|uniref:HEAT repeat-containing protein 6 n=1 Tax=Lycorma delicatula TaxID=130591 RepID=UPI003F50E334
MEKDFDYFVSEFSKLVSGRNESDREHMNKLFDRLNAINYRGYTNLNNDRAVLLIHQCCTLVSPSDTFLVAKCCHLIMNLVSKLGVQINGKSLVVVVNWCCQSLKSSADVALLDVLQALHAVINSQVSSIEEVTKDLIMKLSEELESGATLLCPQEVKLWRIRCIHALACTGTLKPAQVNHCTKIIFDILTVNVELENFGCVQVIASCIEAVQSICQGCPDWLSDNLGDVIGVTLAYLHCGLPGWNYSPPQRLFPIPTPVMPRTSEPKGPSVRGKQRSKAIKQGLKSKENEIQKEDLSFCNANCSSTSFFNDTQWPTSESDFSDSEGGRIAKSRCIQANVRLAVLNLLLKITKLCGCKELFGYYSSLLGSSGLPFSIIHEPAIRVRGTAIATTTALISASKIFFANAQISEVSSYTPFSGVLADLLKSLHDCTIEALKLSNPSLISTSLLHCAAALIKSTPYHRLHSGLLTRLLNIICSFLHLKERNTTVAILTCFGAMLCQDPATDEFINIMSSAPPISNINLLYTKSTEINLSKNKQSWMIELVIKILNDCSSSVQVCVEVWQVIYHMARHHFNFLHLQLSSVIISLQLSLVSSSDVLQLHAGRALEQIAIPMAATKGIEEECIDMWKSLLKGPLLKILQSTLPLAAVACDCLANIGPNIYQLLPGDVQILIITLLFGCSQHEESSVRASAIRAIGMFLSFPCLMEEEQFVFDVSETVINVIKDPVTTVRVKAAWTLGNLTHCLLNSPSAELHYEVSLEVLFEATLTAVQDTENVRVNAIRGLGNIIRLIQPEHLVQPKFKALLEKAVTFLTKFAVTGGNMKLRWNACYALSSLLENDAVQGNNLSTWQEPVLNALCTVLVKCNNFKVRVNASAALSNATSRHLFGSQYTSAWLAVLEGLDNSHNMPDFREFKHQVTLFSQLCITLCNLGKLAEVEDLTPLHDILVYRMDIAKEHIEKFHQSALPEQTTPILTVKNHVAKLSKDKRNLNNIQKATLSMLSNIFSVGS